jgi:hypothetical protein
MLADGGKHLSGRFWDSQASACLLTHTDPQVSERLTARCCGASAEPVIDRGAGATGAIAEVVEKRCGASAEAIAQASSARVAEKIERVMRAPVMS